MKLNNFFSSIIIVLTLAPAVFCQNVIVPHNKIALKASVKVTSTNNLYKFDYLLFNRASAQQSVWDFMIVSTWEYQHQPN